MSKVTDSDVAHGTLAIYRADLEIPFNNPTPGHFSQEFSWREGSVCFYFPPLEICRLELLIEDEPASLQGEPQRIIKVPFTCNESSVEIGDVFFSNITHKFPKGEYQIVFELVPGIGADEDGYPYDYFIRVRFSRDDHPEFAVVKQDALMNFTGQLVTDAKPA